VTNVISLKKKRPIKGDLEMVQFDIAFKKQPNAPRFCRRPMARSGEGLVGVQTPV